MASGFSGGGPDFYTGMAGRSVTNMNNTNNPSQPSYRTQLSQMFLEQNSHQIPQLHRTTSSNSIGKRPLADFQGYQQQHNLNPAALNNLLFRSVKPRMYQHTSPIATLSSIEFSANNNNNSMSPEFTSSLSQRYGVPLLQQLRPHPINLIQNQTSQSLPCMNTTLLQNHNRGGGGGGGGVVAGAAGGNNIMGQGHQQESEKKMMNRLLELEKQLLDDNDDEGGDAVSVITNTNSEWSETIQSLITSSSPNAISPSPTSSSSSSSVTTPVSNCSKQTLLDAASAISEGKYEVATEILSRVSQVSNPRGNSEQRLMEYMLIALKSRVNPAENPPPVAELFSKEQVGSTQLLYELSPCFKHAFTAANLAILECTLTDSNKNNSNGFHVIDFDIGQGRQYGDLLYLLYARQNGKSVKITAIADNNNGGREEKERLRLVGDQLSQVAERVGVVLKFNVVSLCKLGDLSRDSLGCEPDECLVVNFSFKLCKMPDESVSTDNPRDELLRRVKSLEPRVVTLVEQEMNTNTAPFCARVNETCAYYGALFDSIESLRDNNNNNNNNLERVKVEEGLGRKLANSVACEGRDRVERCEVFGKWRARMGMAGFELKPMSQNVAESIKETLNRVNPGFFVKHENGGVSFGWMGKTLTVASAWR